MTEVSEVLKPCPFCGHAATVSEPAPDNWHTWSISCDHCPTPLQPLGSIADDRDAAIVAWNTRPTLASEQTELVEQIRRRIWSITGCSDALAEQAAEALADDLIEALSSVPASNAGWIEFIRRIRPHVHLGPLSHEDRDVVLFGALPSSVPTSNTLTIAREALSEARAYLVSGLDPVASEDERALIATIDKALAAMGEGA